MIDIITKILMLFIFMIFSQTFHEYGHYLSCKKQNRYCNLIFGVGKTIYQSPNKILIIKLFPILACVETNIAWLKDKKAFFLAGAFSQFIYGITFIMAGLVTQTSALINIGIILSIFGATSLIPYHPTNDMFSLLRCNEKFENWYQNLNEILRGLWILLGNIFSLVFGIVIAWIILF